MGDLEDVDARQLRGGGQERALGGGLQVPEQEHGEPGRADQQGDAGVVGAGVVCGPRHGRGRPQDPPVQGAQAAVLAGLRAQQGDAGGGCLTAYEGRLVGGLVQGGGLDGAHGPAAQDPGQAGDMVGVEVGEEEQRDHGDPQGAQTAVDEAGLRAGVDHQSGAVARGQHQRVALTDVAGHQPPGGQRPAGHGPGQRDGAQDGRHDQQYDDGAQPRTPQEAAPHGDRHHREGGEEQGTRPCARPVERRAGQGGTVPGHRRDPAGRPGGEPGEGLGGGYGERCGGQGGEPQDGGRAHRELRQQIAGDGHQADVGGQDGHHRGAHRLRGTRRGQDLRQTRRHPPAPQGGAPARREGEEGTGGQHGQGEAVRAREPGVVEEQHQCGRAQRGQQAATPARADGEQGDQPAGGRAQHAGIGTAHDDEPRGEHSPEHRRQPERDRQPRRETTALGTQGGTGRTDQEDQDQREIGAADRGQMGQVGGLERVVQLHRDTGRVTDDQTR